MTDAYISISTAWKKNPENRTSFDGSNLAYRIISYV